MPLMTRTSCCSSFLWLSSHINQRSTRRTATRCVRGLVFHASSGLFSSQAVICPQTYGSFSYFLRIRFFAHKTNPVSPFGSVSYFGQGRKLQRPSGPLVCEHFVHEPSLMVFPFGMSNQVMFAFKPFRTFDAIVPPNVRKIFWVLGSFVLSKVLRGVNVLSYLIVVSDE